MAILGNAAVAADNALANAGAKSIDQQERDESIAEQKRLAKEAREDIKLQTQLKNELERLKTVSDMSRAGPSATSKAAGEYERAAAG